ncbi:MAG: polysaccharide biosynthesis tyrosine autokinase [Burkholderiaceae bacterium]
MNALSPLPPSNSVSTSLDRPQPGIEPFRPVADAQELLNLWGVLARHRKLLLILGLSAAVVAAVLTFMLPSTYRSTVSLLVEPGRSKILSSIEDLRQVGENREYFQAQVEILQSRDLAVRTARQLRLWDVPAFDPRASGGGPIGWIKNALGLADSNKAWTEPKLLDAAVEQLIKSTRVEALRISGVAKLSVETTDPELAARIANTYAAQYERADNEAHLNIARNASTMLQEKLSELREKLERSEAALQAYREKKGIVKLGGSAEAMTTQQLNAMTERLVAASARRAELEGTWAQLRDLRESDYAAVAAVQRDPGVIDAQTRVNISKARVAEYSLKYGSEHVTLKEAQAQLQDAQRALANQRRAIIEGINREYQSALNTERELTAQLEKARGSAADLNREEFQLVGLEREVEMNRQLYDLFLTRAKETSVAAEVHDSAARVIDPAVAASKPFGPKRGAIVLLAFVLASSLGAFVVLIRHALDKTIKGEESAEQKLQLPVLGALPVLPADKREMAASLMITEPASLYAESMRTLRTGVLLGCLDSPSKLVLVTSTLRAEGKTTVAANLALANAYTGRTLLIDCDLRSPQVGIRLGISRQSKGLTNLLAGAPLHECVHLVKNSPLHVLPSGETAPNPQELLLSRHFRQTLMELSQQFDMIVIDSPPVEPLSDALVLASIVPYTLLVVKSNTTPYPEIQKSVERIRRTGTKMLGIALNHAELSPQQELSYRYANGEDEPMTTFLPEPH